MDSEVRLDSAVKKVSLTRRSGPTEIYDFRETPDGEARRITVIRRDATRLLLSVDDKIYSVRPVSRNAGEITFLLNGELVTASRPSRTGGSVAGSSIASVDELVVSHFPAKVVRVLAGPHHRAHAGETLLVLEAMKMETNLEAPRDCTVLELFVTEGQMVARGTKLARLDFS